MEGNKDEDGEQPGGGGASQRHRMTEAVVFQKQLQRGQQFHEHEGEDDEGDIATVNAVEAGPVGSFHEFEHGVVDQLNGPDEPE